MANSLENAHLPESVNSESLHALTTARPGDMVESNSTRTPPEPNSPTPAPVDIYDWYQIGEYMDYMDSIGNLRFYRAAADTLEDTYNVLNQLLVKVHCSDQTLDEFKQVVGFFKSLPPRGSSITDRPTSRYNEIVSRFMKGTKNMDTLVFGLIAVNNFNKQQEPIVPEPAEFQPFDLRKLECFNARDNSPSRSSDRKQSYVAQTVS